MPTFRDPTCRMPILASQIPRGASLREADLTGANFAGAELDGADFAGATMGATILGHAPLTGAQGLEPLSTDFHPLSASLNFCDRQTSSPPFSFKAQVFRGFRIVKSQLAAQWNNTTHVSLATVTMTAPSRDACMTSCNAVEYHAGLTRSASCQETTSMTT